MNTPTLGLAAFLMLGGASIAAAEEMPRDSKPGSARAMERGSGGDEGARNAFGGGVRAEGPNPDARKDPPEAERSGAERTDGKRADDRGERRERTNANRKSDDAKGAERGSRAETREKADDTSGGEGRPKRDAQAKQDRGERGERANEDRGKDTPSKDAADSEKSKPADTGKEARRDKGEADTAGQGERAAPDAAKKADLSGEKRERLNSAFRDSRDVKRRTDVDINIAVGTRLPGDWDFAPVPIAVVAVVPEYRGYVFTYVDDEYVICDPVTYEVVAVLPAAGGSPRHAASNGGSADRCSETLTLTLSDGDRDYILRSIQMTDEVDVSGVTVGWAVPGDIELRPFPESVVSRTGQLATCRYFVAEDQIAIVDPAEETVVMLIDHD